MIQREAAVKEKLEERLAPYAAAVQHGHDLLVWERPLVSLIAAALVAAAVRCAHLALTRLPLASAACLGLAIVVLASYVIRAFPDVGQAAFSTVASLLPAPISQFGDVTTKIARNIAATERVWDSLVEAWSKGLPEPMSRIAAIATCLAASYLISFVSTGVVIGVSLALIATVPGIIHHDLPRRALEAVSTATAAAKQQNPKKTD